MAKNLTSSRRWTREELQYLEENWGSKGAACIAKHLGRSQEGIKLKASRIGLGRATDNGEYITYVQLAKALGIHSDGTTRKRMLDAGMPVIKKKMYTARFHVIYIDKFWKWAENNKDLFEFDRLQKGDLGPEPKWVAEKRRADFERRRDFKNRYKKWTDGEVEKLIFLVSQNTFTNRQVSETLSRTEGSILRKLHELGISNRPVGSNSKRYSGEEDKVILEMLDNHYTPEVIAKRINRTASSTRYRIKVLREKQEKNYE